MSVSKNTSDVVSASRRCTAVDGRAQKDVDFADPVPPSIVSMLLDWSSCKWKTPFGRFFEVCSNSTLAWCQRKGTGFADAGSSATSVYPMPLPFPEVLNRECEMKHLRTFESRRQRKSLSSRHLANATVAMFNFFDAGCPRGGPPLVFADRDRSAAQVDAARRIHREAEVLCACSGGDVSSTGRGRSRLNDMIFSLQTRYGETGKRLKESEKVTLAEKVVPSMVSLPTKAAHLRGASLMCPERA